MFPSNILTEIFVKIFSLDIVQVFECSMHAELKTDHNKKIRREKLIDLKYVQIERNEQKFW